MTSGNIHDAQAPQKIRAKIGPDANGKGRNCIFSRSLRLMTKTSLHGYQPGDKVGFILGRIRPRTAAILRSSVDEILRHGCDFGPAGGVFETDPCCPLAV